MVSYPIGELVAERVKAMGVRPFYKRFEHDGVTGPNIAAVYSDRGHGVRAPVVFYNRSNEAAARLRPGDFDWKAICAPALVRDEHPPDAGAGDLLSDLHAHCCPPFATG